MERGTRPRTTPVAGVNDISARTLTDGPSLPTMTTEWIWYFNDKFSASAVRLIAEAIISLGNHPDRYEIACKRSQYNYINGRWMGTAGKSVYKRLTGACKRLAKKRERQKLADGLANMKRRQEEKDETIKKQRKVLGKLVPLRSQFQNAQMKYRQVQKQHDRIFNRYRG